MLKDNKNLWVIAGQVLFFSLFCFYYLHYSFLRPICEKKLEWALAITLVLAMAVNYWIIYPLFYKRHSFWHYAIATVVEALLATIFEYCLTLNIVTACIPQETPLAVVSKLKRGFFCNLLLRDSCLLSFVGLMANNIGQKFRFLETDVALLKRKNQVVVLRKNEQYILNANDICYLIQDQNYTDIYANDGQLYKRRGPMRFFEILKESQGYTKISRNCAVFLPYVQTLTDKEVTVQAGESGSTVSLPLGTTMAPGAILAIEHYLQNQKKGDKDRKSKDESHEEQAFVSAVFLQDASEGPTPDIPTEFRHTRTRNNKKYSIIREFISTHPKCNIQDIVSGTDIPKSTVTRILAELKKDGLIEYVGSKKTGGYQVVKERQEA